jgi:hypothetical protein
MALSPSSLIRMRSQVQVLAGPPPIVAGHSAAGAEPGALPACLGRAGAARPSPPARSVTLPGPSTRTAGATTTTDSSRAPSPGRQPRGRCGNLVLQPAPVPSRSRQRRALPRPSTEPLDDAAAHWDLDPLPPCRLPCRIDPVPTPPPDVGRDGRVRTDGGGHQTTGRVDTGRPDRRTPGRRARVSGHRTGWTPAGRTARPRTTKSDGWTPHGGRAPATGVMAGVLAWWTTATAPDRWMAVLDRAARGWRGVVMTPAGVRLAADLRRQLLFPSRPEEVVDRPSAPRRIVNGSPRPPLFHHQREATSGNRVLHRRLEQVAAPPAAFRVRDGGTSWRNATGLGSRRHSSR